MKFYKYDLINFFIMNFVQNLFLLNDKIYLFY